MFFTHQRRCSSKLTFCTFIELKIYLISTRSIVSYPFLLPKSTQCVILENLGLAETVELAKNALSKSQN
ncbi:hypothetical protein AAY47_05950, partial [Xenorhabdus griffiniae]